MEMASEFEDDDDVASWGSSLEKIFIDVMADEVKKGNMENFQFSRSTWRRMVFEIYKRGGRSLNLKQVKQKFYRLRQKHREFSLLLSQPGVAWDSETNIVHAPENIWKNYIQASPHGKKFRTKGVAAYKSLDVIFSSSTSTGIVHRATPFTQAPLIMDEADELDDNKDCIAPIFRHGMASLDGVLTFNSPPEQNIRRDGREPEISEGLNARTDAAKTQPEVNLTIPEQHRATQRGEGSWTPSSDPYTINKCMAVLNDLKGVSDDAYSKVLKLFKDPDWREIFMNIPGERMLGWVERL